MSDSNEAFEKCRTLIDECRAEISKRVVGQQQVVDGILMGLITGGHILLEGVPGLAKTLAVKTFSDITGLDFKRIQFTPDLLPADVTGTLIYEQSTGGFSVRKGPVFTNLVLADEINRAPAKVQSALLEAMAEKQVTIGDKTYSLPEPFLVLATQNPVEQDGTYSLPEAELDRFMLKILVPYPTPENEVEIVKAGGKPEKIAVNKVLDVAKINECRNQLENIKCADEIIEYIVSLVNVTRPSTVKNHAGIRATAAGRNRDDILKYITFGVSPRGGIALCQCAKAAALFEGRSFVLPEDVKRVAPLVLRHRFVLSYEAAADGITADDLISKILSLMPVP
ncbi:MAG: MoxR family ATPase [Treponemataceae bacterium]|nr:MoxR family ATPase [Treponemataceae bacterium]